MKPMNGGAFSKASGIIASASIAMTAPAAKERMSTSGMKVAGRSRRYIFTIWIGIPLLVGISAALGI
jgi:hypothetical protein